MNKINIFIDLYPEKFILLLKKDGELANSLEICFDRNLAEKLLEGIDKILKMNKLNKTDLNSLELVKKPNKNRTSDRIALSIIEAHKTLQ